MLDEIFGALATELGYEYHGSMYSGSLIGQWRWVRGCSHNTDVYGGVVCHECPPLILNCRIVRGCFEIHEQGVELKFCLADPTFETQLRQLLQTNRSFEKAILQHRISVYKRLVANPNCPAGPLETAKQLLQLDEQELAVLC